MCNIVHLFWEKIIRQFAMSISSTAKFTYVQTKRWKKKRKERRTIFFLSFFVTSSRFVSRIQNHKWFVRLYWFLFWSLFPFLNGGWRWGSGRSRLIGIKSHGGWYRLLTRLGLYFGQFCFAFSAEWRSDSFWLRRDGHSRDRDRCRFRLGPRQSFGNPLGQVAQLRVVNGSCLLCLVLKCQQLSRLRRG